MPDCHKCQHNNNPSPASPCPTCAGPAETAHNDGKRFVSVEEVAAFIPAPDPAPSPSGYDHAVHFIRALCGMGMIEREVVFSRLNGQGYREITARLNLQLAKRVTIQAVHLRAKKASGADPAFAELFRAMVAKQQRRKTRQEKGGDDDNGNG